MKLFEVRRVPPLRCANIAALVHAILAACFAVLFVPIIFLVTAAARAPAARAAPALPFAMGTLMILYPLMGAVMGWFIGLIGAAAYNLVTRYTGGIELEGDEVVIGMQP